MTFIKNHGWWLVLLGLLMLLVVWFLNNKNATPLTTTTAEIGDVTTFVSVSGVASVDDIIPLSFPKTGTVSGVFVRRGDEVATGTVLATIGDTSLQAEYQAALAEVTRARANRDELHSGQTREEAEVTATILANAETALNNTIRTEATRVETARTTLYSSGLNAVALDADTEAPAPTVSGSYTCRSEGVYRIELFRSTALSGYSYRFSGIETGTGNVSTLQSSPLGECGLRLQFTPHASYSNTIFTITIPNQNSPVYSNNRALLNQALAQQSANVKAAERALALARNQASVATAGARVERLLAANAAVASAEARLNQVSYNLSESALRAPTSGLITSVDIVVGQSVSATPVITLFSPRQTIVEARVPEKAIAQLQTGQVATVVFDANPEEKVAGQITFLSPVPVTISGIPYYLALIEITASPTWLRSGMQADVKIITTKISDAVRIPRLYLIDDHITIKNGAELTTVKPEVILIGSDGFVALSGINAGTEVVLPTN